MLRHAIKQFKKETGITKVKEKLYSNKRLKTLVISLLILLSFVCLTLSNRSKLLGKEYSKVVVDEISAQNLASICAVKPELQICLDSVELFKVSSQLSFLFSIWQVTFFFYWWVWVWRSVDNLIKIFKEKLAS